MLIIELPAGAIAATVAAANTCLAKSNKSEAGGKATKKRVSDKRRQNDPDHPLFMGRSAPQLEGRSLDLDARRRGPNSRRIDYWIRRHVIQYWHEAHPSQQKLSPAKLAESEPVALAWLTAPTPRRPGSDEQMFGDK